MAQTQSLLKQGLSRRLRPKHFDEVVGQGLIIQALKNAISDKRLNPVILFSGTRGIGKTTLARLVAQAAQCDAPDAGSPCGQCALCQSMQKGGMIDLVEVDAASKNKVEDMRALLDQMHYAPHEGRYKVLILDEVHMLSNHSFNALLKTLEEPMSHQLFLMATTDPQKLPETILSRCLHFQLKPIASEDLRAHLEAVCAKESVSCDEEGMDLLVHYARGSIRDALSLLDQLIALKTTLVAEDITSMIGTVSESKLYQLWSAIIQQDVTQSLTLAQDWHQAHAQFDLVLKQMMQCMHDALAGIKPKNAAADDLAQLTALPDHQKHAGYALMQEGLRSLAWAPSPYLGFRMVLMRLCHLDAPSAAQSAAAVSRAARSHLAASQSEGSRPAQAQQLAPSPVKQASVAKPATEAQPVPSQAASPASDSDAASHDWATIYPQLGLKGLTLALCAHMRLLSVDPQNQICVFEIDSAQATILNDRIEQKIADSMAVYLGMSACRLQVSSGRAAQPKADVKKAKQPNKVAVPSSQAVAPESAMHVAKTSKNISKASDSTEAPVAAPQQAGKADAVLEQIEATFGAGLSSKKTVETVPE